MVAFDSTGDLLPEAFETDRLRLARFDRDVGIRELYRAFSENEPGIEETARYLPYGPLDHPKDAADRLSEREQQWEQNDRAQWAIRPRDGEDGAGEFAGMGALILDWERRLAKPAIWLRRRFWGRGYSGERREVRTGSGATREPPTRCSILPSIGWISTAWRCRSRSATSGRGARSKGTSTATAGATRGCSATTGSGRRGPSTATGSPSPGRSTRRRARRGDGQPIAAGRRSRWIQRGGNAEPHDPGRRPEQRAPPPGPEDGVRGHLRQ
jgi:hypothetical protein